MPICFAMVQAVGTAAALTVRTKNKVKNIDETQLQKMLISQSVEAPC